MIEIIGQKYNGLPITMGGHKKNKEIAFNSPIRGPLTADCQFCTSSSTYTK